MPFFYPKSANNKKQDANLFNYKLVFILCFNFTYQLILSFYKIKSLQ
nr:MAG TPA: hypothetical protein [Caudoviricetes sp.]